MRIENLTTIPSVKEKSYSFDIVSRLLQDRVILFASDFNTDSCAILVSQILYLRSVSKTDEINILIDSPGGSVVSGLSVLDTIQSTETPINTTTCGMAASMGFLLAICGHRGRRKAYKNAQLMAHAVSSGAKGTIHDMEISLDHTRKLNELLTDIIVKRGNLTKAQVKKMMERDTWLSAEEALKHGFIDEIITCDYDR